MTIEDIKTELREIVELSGKITSAGKFCEGWPEETAIISKVCNLTPKMAKALLTAIEALEWMNNDEHGGEVCDNDGRGCRACGYAQNQLETIRREWEAQA
jgi:hypothetical protein